ncbi:MAG TPA: hypothetical protein VMU84_16950 [Thermoanaerobaculia bacterium]|nr:hypothetical protein [Thermoanaerobaculia bacterium]
MRGRTTGPVFLQLSRGALVSPFMRNAAIALSLLFVAASAFADRDVSRSVSVKAPRGKVQRVFVDIPAGELHIRNSSDNSLIVDGVIRRNCDDSSSRARAQAIVDDTSIEVIVEGNEATIRRKLGTKAHSWSAENLTSFDLRVDLPKGVDVEVGTRFGEVRIEGTFGNVEADLRAGELEFRSPRAAVGELSASCTVGEVRTDLGDRIVDREGLFPGRTYFVNATGAKTRVKLHVTAGEVRVKLAQ